MVLIGMLLFLLFPLWGIWLVFSMFFGNTFLTPKKIIHIVRTKHQFRKNKDAYYMLLVQKVPYFGKLTQEQQTVFYRRIRKFISNKAFVPVEMPEVKPEDKVLIAAAAIQLTFGLDVFILTRFHTIYVYPDVYYNPTTKHKHKGEVNMHGTIKLSIKDFHRGNSIANDGINLGLHEMAHALRVEQFLEQDSDDFFNSYFSKIAGAIHEEISNVENEEFIREYGKSNVHEFFAVCVENFFERPKKFKVLMPELYAHFVLLLNQDPEASSFSVASNRNFTDNQSEQVSDRGELLFSKSSSRYIFFLLAILGVFVKTFPNYEFAVFLVVIYLILLLVSTKKVFFYSNGIALKSWYMKTPSYYSFSRIVLVLITNPNFHHFCIKYRIASRISSKVIRLKLDDSERKQLQNLLQSHKIGVKEVGRF